MKHCVKHHLDAQTARRVAEKAWESYSERFSRYQPRIRWISDQRAEVGFTAKGISLGGALELSDGEIGMELDVPFLLRPFKRRAIGVIEEEIRKWVKKAEDGEV